MNIVYFLNNFPLVSESFIINEIIGLERKGHNVLIIAKNDPDQDVQHDLLHEMDADVHYLDSPSYSKLTELIGSEVINKEVFRSLKDVPGLKHKIKQAFYVKKTTEYINSTNFKPDLIQTHFADKSKFLVDATAKNLDVPWTIEVHAYGIFTEENIPAAQKILKKPDRIITISQYNKNYLKNELGISKPVDVVPVSIDLNTFQTRGLEEQNKIVSVGRLVEKKGLKYGIKAFAQIADQYPELEYNIIGKGEKREELEKLVKEEKLEDRINLLGHVADERLKQEMEEAKVFLLPCVIAKNGDRDGIPTVLKEAMALETPCVSTNISGIPELVEDGKNGILVESKNFSMLSSALDRLLSNRKYREDMGFNAGKNIVNNYSIDQSTLLLLESFRDVTG